MSPVYRSYVNRIIVDKLRNIVNLLQINGEVPYRVSAYRRAADALDELDFDISELEQDSIENLDGVGKTIATKLKEYIDTGTMGFYEELIAEVPESLLDVLQIPGLGPKKVALLWNELNVTNIIELQTVIDNGQLLSLKGFGKQSVEKILQGIKTMENRSNAIPLGDVWDLAFDLKTSIENINDVDQAAITGDIRRRKDMVDEICLVVSATEGNAIQSSLSYHRFVADVIAQTPNSFDLLLVDGKHVKVAISTPLLFPLTKLFHTGSQVHIEALQSVAEDKSFSLGVDGLINEDRELAPISSEAEIYQSLGMRFIPPELREGRGEISLALHNKLPTLITLDDIKGDFQSHSTWSDGRASILEMVEKAMSLGLISLAITDHSQSLGIAGGLSIDDIHSQRREIEHIKDEIGNLFTLLHGIEVEIKSDGTLDYPDEILAEFDLVVASLHTGLRQSREQVTMRMLAAINHPHVDIIGHPTGRLLPHREPANLDLKEVFSAAARTGTALEINAHPSRLDLKDTHAQEAAEMGVLFSINTDAHHPKQLELMHFGVATARRAWLQPNQVINTWSTEKLLDWLKQSKPRSLIP